MIKKNRETNKSGKKNKAYRTVTICRGADVVFSGAVSDLTVGEKMVVAKSVEFFDDPEPCFIHRSAVAARLYGEFEQWLDARGSADGFRVELTELPAHIRGYFFED